MDLAIELLVVGILVPAAIAGVVTWSALRFRLARFIQLYALPAAAATAFAISYILLPDEWAAIKPERHWQWLPYLAAAAALAGPATLASARAAWVRSLVVGGLAVGTAFLLVPAWPDLKPARPVSIVLLAIYLDALMSALDWLAPRLPVAWLLALLTAAAGVLAAALAIDVIRFGQLAGIAAAALGGSWLVAVFIRGSETLDPRGLTPLFAVLAGGMSCVGCVEPEQPLWWLLLIPTIPLAIGPILSRFKLYRASASSAQ